MSVSASESCEIKPLTLYIRGGHAPTYLYRIIADHYRAEDIELDKINAYQ